MNCKNFIIDKKENQFFFPKGRYDFYPSDCTQKYCYFCNNDEGVKLIAFDLSNLENAEIIGDQAEFWFHGRISPLIAFRCRHLKIQGISINFEDSFVSDANFIKQEDGYAWFQLTGKYWCEKKRLRFTDDFYDNLSNTLRFYAYDISKKELDTSRKVILVPNQGIIERDNCIGIPDVFGNTPCNAYVIKHEERLCPGLVFDQCENVTIKDVQIHHCAGMGLLAQNSENIRLDHVHVTSAGRRIAASDDAVHFVECRGDLRIQNCDLADTLDDSINVHGIYRPLRQRTIGGSFYYLDTGHFQQLGLPGARKDDTLILIKNDTNKPYYQAKLTNATLVNKAMTAVEFEKPLPKEFTPGDCAMVKAVSEATLIVQNCKLKSLLGRGVLASGLASVEIRDNYIHTPGAGVFISGGADFWYETGPVKSILVENNIFDNCNYGTFVATREPLSIFPELQKFTDNFYYYDKIIVQRNHFKSSLRPLISAQSVNEFICLNNSFELDHHYPFNHSGYTGYYFTDATSGAIATKHCKNTEFSNNIGFVDKNIGLKKTKSSDKK